MTKSGKDTLDFKSGQVVATQGNHTLMAAPSGSGLGILPDSPALASDSMKTGYVAEQLLAKAKAAGIPVLHLMPEGESQEMAHKRMESILAEAKDKGESQD
jgi:hypothetical protein